jgi:hypothetical protein
MGDYEKQPIEYEVLSVMDLKDYPKLMKTIDNDFPKASLESKLKIASLVIGTCGFCNNSEAGCHCTWDD